jgi:hypothetical protein
MRHRRFEMTRFSKALLLHTCEREISLGTSLSVALHNQDHSKSNGNRFERRVFAILIGKLSHYLFVPPTCLIFLDEHQKDVRLTLEEYRLHGSTDDHGRDLSSTRDMPSHGESTILILLCHVPNSTTITQRLVHTPITRELLLILLLQRYLSISPMRNQRLSCSVKDLACRLAKPLTVRLEQGTNCDRPGQGRGVQGRGVVIRRYRWTHACRSSRASTSCPMEILQAIATGLECRICWRDD